MNKAATISVSDLQAQLDAINGASGKVIAVLHHPYLTDGTGPMLVVVWSE